MRYNFTWLHTERRKRLLGPNVWTLFFACVNNLCSIVWWVSARAPFLFIHINMFIRQEYSKFRAVFTGSSYYTHPPYCSDLIHPECHLFPNIHFLITGWRFDCDNDVIKAKNRFWGVQFSGVSKEVIKRLDQARF